jgi:hypothetical protein
MKRAAISLASAVLAISVFAESAGAQADSYPPGYGYGQPFVPVTTVGGGPFGLFGYLFASPPFAQPFPAPRYGCYFTRVRTNSAWRRVEVCY